MNIEVTIDVRATATCPSCKRRLEKTLRLSSAEIQEVVSPDLLIKQNETAAAAEVQAEMAKRGWRENCGRCHDPEADLNARPPRTRFRTGATGVIEVSGEDS